MKNFSTRFKSIIVKTIVFSLIVGVLTAVLKYSGALPTISRYWHWILIFYLIITIFAFYQLLKSLYQRPKNFVFIYLGISLARMLLFTIISLMYAFGPIKSNAADAVSFILTFAVYYIFFTLWEVVLVLSSVKRYKSEVKSEI